MGVCFCVSVWATQYCFGFVYFTFIILFQCSVVFLNKSIWTLTTPRFGPILTPPQTKRRISVTETPTTRGPSSVVMGSSRRGSDIWRTGLGREIPGEYRRPKYCRFEEAARLEAREAAPKMYWGGHMGSVAKSGRRPEPNPCAYRRARGTGQAPCYVVERTVSPGVCA